MRNIYSGTELSKESRKKHQERTLDGLENQLVGRSRRQREMDDFYDERRSKMKSMMIERQNTEKVDVQTLIGRPKNLILIPNTTENTSSEVNETAKSCSTLPSVKSEIDIVNTTESDSVCIKKNIEEKNIKPSVVGPAEIYQKLVKGVKATSVKKYRAAISMIARLLGPEGGGWLSIETLHYMSHLIYSALMSPYLKDEKCGGDARLDITKLLVKPMKQTIIEQRKMNVRTPTGDLLELPLDNDVFEKVELAWIRALILTKAYNDDILIIQSGISKLIALIEKHHSEAVLEMVKMRENIDYEAASQTLGAGAVNIINQSKEATGNDINSNDDSNTEGDVNSATSQQNGDLVIDKDKSIWSSINIPSIREDVIEEGLESYFDLVKVTRSRRDVEALFLRAYHYRDNFNNSLQERIINWQTSIKDGSALGRSGTGPSVQIAGVAGHAVQDARTDRLTFSSGADTWARKQKGVL